MLLLSRFHPRVRCLDAGYLLPALAATIVLTLGPPAAAQDSFHEEFDRLDRERWYVSDGWTNGDHQNCWWSKNAIDLRDGMLVLQLRPNDDPERPYICGEIQTTERYKYGTYEVRYRTEQASGLNAAFFTYIGPVHKRPHDEIDVEILSRDPGRVEFNTFVDGKMANGGETDLDPPADEAFQHFAFVWEEDRIRWFLNGELVHETTEEPLVENAQKIFLSHWSSDTLTDWMGPFSNPERPVEMTVDWVAWTAPGDECQFPQSLLCISEEP